MTGEGERDKTKEVGMENSEMNGRGKAMEVVELMDTPDRRSMSQIAPQLSRIEESPVFTYLNNLSPIRPIKPAPQAYVLLSSPPPVFASPQVIPLRESRFMRRHQSVDPSRPEFSVDTKTEGGCNNVAHNNSHEQQGHVGSSGEGSGDPSSNSSKLTDEHVRILKYDTPISSSRASCAPESPCAAEFASTSGAIVPFEQPTSGKGIYENRMNIDELNETNQIGDAAGCDWENLLADADQLIFNSPDAMDAARKFMEPSSGLYTHISNMQNIQTLCPHRGRNVTDHPSTQPGDGNYLREFSGMQGMLAGTSMNNDIVEGSLHGKTNVPVSHLYRGFRRRCLDFDGNSSSVSPILMQQRNMSSTDRQLVPMRSVNDSTRHILPAIGLHLNALAITPKVGKQDGSVPGRVVIAPPSSMTNSHSLTTGQEQVNQPVAISSMERDMDVVESEVPLQEDAGQASANVVAEELNSSGRIKKRRKPEQDSETVGCKRCNCRRSKCLKLYCECFGAGVYCMEPCSCQGCFNKPIHQDTVLATRKQIELRSPNAFAPKVIKGSGSPTAAGGDPANTPASDRHKRGCNCKKSGCHKKYCECYQGGVGCFMNCRCESCKNPYGRKDGPIFMGTITETQDDGTKALEKSAKERVSRKTATQYDKEQNPESAPLATPYRFHRSLPQVPFSPKKKPPRSSLGGGSLGTSSSLQGNSYQAVVVKTSFLPPPQHRFDEQFDARVMDDEMPEILQHNRSPISGIKSGSPNSKRVSSPHSNFGMSSSPGRRSSRKSILQSIPAFPSLTPKNPKK